MSPGTIIMAPACIMPLHTRRSQGRPSEAHLHNDDLGDDRNVP